MMIRFDVLLWRVGSHWSVANNKPCGWTEKVREKKEFEFRVCGVCLYFSWLSRLSAWQLLAMEARKVRTDQPGPSSFETAPLHFTDTNKMSLFSLEKRIDFHLSRIMKGHRLINFKNSIERLPTEKRICECIIEVLVSFGRKTFPLISTVRQIRCRRSIWWLVRQR